MTRTTVRTRIDADVIDGRLDLSLEAKPLIPPVVLKNLQADASDRGVDDDGEVAVAIYLKAVHVHEAASRLEPAVNEMEDTAVEGVTFPYANPRGEEVSPDTLERFKDWADSDGLLYRWAEEHCDWID